MGTGDARGSAGSPLGCVRRLAGLVLLAVALTLGAQACTTADDAALAPGTFRFTSVDHNGLGYAWTIVIEPDGAVTISSTPGTYALLGCHGVLTASELSELGSTLGAAHFLERDGESLRSFASSDPPALDLTLEIVSGPDAGRRSHVYYEPIGADARLDQQAERDSKVAPAERARRERAAAATQRYFRRLGVRRVVAHVVRRGGQVEIALFVPLDVAESLTATPALPTTNARPKPLARAAVASPSAPKRARAG